MFVLWGKCVTVQNGFIRLIIWHLQKQWEISCLETVKISFFYIFFTPVADLLLYSKWRIPQKVHFILNCVTFWYKNLKLAKLKITFIEETRERQLMVDSIFLEYWFN